MRTRMQYPNDPSGKNDWYDGRAHEIEPLLILEFNLHNTTYYVMQYNDCEYGRVGTTILTMLNGRLVKVPLSDYKHLVDYLNGYEIKKSEIKLPEFIAVSEQIDIEKLFGPNKPIINLSSVNPKTPQTQESGKLPGPPKGAMAQSGPVFGERRPDRQIPTGPTSHPFSPAYGSGGYGEVQTPPKKPTSTTLKPPPSGPMFGKGAYGSGSPKVAIGANPPTPPYHHSYPIDENIILYVPTDIKGEIIGNCSTFRYVISRKGVEDRPATYEYARTKTSKEIEDKIVSAAYVTRGYGEYKFDIDKIGYDGLETGGKIHYTIRYARFINLREYERITRSEEVKIFVDKSMTKFYDEYSVFCDLGMGTLTALYVEKKPDEMSVSIPKR